MTPQSLQMGLGWATGAAGGGGIGIGELDAMGPAMGGMGIVGGMADFSSALTAVFLASACCTAGLCGGLAGALAGTGVATGALGVAALASGAGITLAGATATVGSTCFVTPVGIHPRMAPIPVALSKITATEAAITMGWRRVLPIVVVPWVCVSMLFSLFNLPMPVKTLSGRVMLTWGAAPRREMSHAAV